VIWVGTDDGNVQLTRDGGKTWTNFRGKIAGLPLGAWIPQIQASKHNAAEAWVVANDYRRGDFKPYIFFTSDYGKTWTRIVDEKKVNGYALCVLQDPAEPNLLFAGTEHGLWVSFDKGLSFQQWKNGFPSVSTFDLAIQEREADLVIATFGRAIWVLDNIRPLREVARNKGMIPSDKRLFAYAAGDAYQVEYKNAPGYEWSTWGIWDAPNRPAGAPLTYMVNYLSKDTGKAAAKLDTVQVRIFNDKNEQIRSLRFKADTGINIKYWGMEQKGARFPGSPKPRPDAPEPRGLQVLPGTYKVVYQLGDAKDSSMITVKDDPRTGNRNSIKIAQAAMVERLQKGSEKLNAGMDRLTEADDLLKKMDAQLKDVEGRSADSLRKATKAMQDSVKAIRESIAGKRIERQGYGQLPQVTVLNTWQQAYQSIVSKTIAPGAQEEMLVKRAEGMMENSVNRINNFFNGAWKQYRTQVETTKVDLFKNYEPIR
jgi:hypothetical protein